MANLYNLTEDPLRCILSYLKMKEILNLRKVSWNIQNTIDVINPNFNIRRVYITQNSQNIVFTIFTDRYMMITYKDSLNRGSPRGCYVKTKRDGDGVFVENGNYMHVFAKDLEILLNNRKSVLELLRIRLCSNEIISKELMTAISNALESNVQQLKVKEVEMTVTKQAQLFEVFRCIDPDKLEIIELSKTIGPSLEISEACELNQWKQAERLEMKNLTVPDIHHNLTHFKRFDGEVNNITPDDLLYLKEKLKKSPNFEQAIIRYANFNNSERLSQLFPGFEYNEEADKNCIFKFSGTNRHLGFKFRSCYSIVIQNLDESELADWFAEDFYFINE